jgi:hypothetical protein
MKPAAGLALVVLLAPAPSLGSSIDVVCDGALAKHVDDDGAGDDDLDAGEIEFTFACTDVPGLWEGTGRVVGRVSAASALTVLTEFTAHNLGNGPVIAGDLPGTGTLNVIHSFELFAPELRTFAFLSGYYDNVDGAAAIGGADLDFLPFANDLLVGAINPPRVADVPPTVAFGGVSGPLLLQAAFEHDLDFDFYLDGPGDAWVLPGASAELHSVPEPGTGALALLGLVLLARSLRRSRTPGSHSSAKLTTRVSTGGCSSASTQRKSIPPSRWPAVVSQLRQRGPGSRCATTMRTEPSGS